MLFTVKYIKYLITLVLKSRDMSVNNSAVTILFIDYGNP